MAETVSSRTYISQSLAAFIFGTAVTTLAASGSTAPADELNKVGQIWRARQSRPVTDELHRSASIFA